MATYKINFRHLNKQLNEFALSRLTDFCRFVDTGMAESSRKIDEEQERLAREGKDQDEHYRFLYEGKLEGDSETLAIVHELAGQLAVLALNHQIENRTKALIQSHNAKSAESLKYKDYEKFQALLLKRLGVNAKAIPGEDAVNEVRLVANSIKHEDGKVSKALAKEYPAWKKGKVMQGLMEFSQVRERDAKAYLDGLVDVLISDNGKD